MIQWFSDVIWGSGIKYNFAVTFQQFQPGGKRYEYIKGKKQRRIHARGDFRGNCAYSESDFSINKQPERGFFMVPVRDAQTGQVLASFRVAGSRPVDKEYSAIMAADMARPGPDSCIVWDYRRSAFDGLRDPHKK